MKCNQVLEITKKKIDFEDLSPGKKRMLEFLARHKK